METDRLDELRESVTLGGVTNNTTANMKIFHRDPGDETGNSEKNLSSSVFNETERVGVVTTTSNKGNGANHRESSGIRKEDSWEFLSSSLKSELMTSESVSGKVEGDNRTEDETTLKLFPGEPTTKNPLTPLSPHNPKETMTSTTIPATRVKFNRDATAAEIGDAGISRNYRDEAITIFGDSWDTTMTMSTTTTEDDGSGGERQKKPQSDGETTTGITFSS